LKKKFHTATSVKILSRLGIIHHALATAKMYMIVQIKMIITMRAILVSVNAWKQSQNMAVIILSILGLNNFAIVVVPTSSLKDQTVSIPMDLENGIQRHVTANAKLHQFVMKISSTQTTILALVIAKLSHQQEAAQQTMLGVAQNVNAQFAQKDVDHHMLHKKLRNF
jgi:hypothetical protein